MGCRFRCVPVRPNTTDDGVGLVGGGDGGLLAIDDVEARQSRSMLQAQIGGV